MLNWLASVVNLITGAINDVKNWIIKIIQTVYSYVDGELTALGRELVDVWNQLYAFIQSVERYAISVYNTLSTYVVKALNDMLKWTVSELNTLRSYVDDALSWLNRTLADIVNTLRRYIDDSITWLQKNILNPLINAVQNMVSWIEQAGTYMYNLLTHPDLLAAFLGHYLWSSYLDLLKRYSAPIGKWLLHSMLGLAGDFVDVLETIISAIL